MVADLIERIRRAYRPEVAWRHMAAISQFHRIQASPGYSAAAGYVAGQLAAAGIDVTVRRYPADTATHFWGTPSFQEWDCRAATLDLLDEQGRPAERLCDFAAIPISVIQRSIPVTGDFDLVCLPGDGDASGLAGKLVLTDRGPGALLQPVIRGAGAAGFVFDGMAAGGRTELDLPDARQYTSFWWSGGHAADAFGFVLSPRQGRALRRRLANGERLRVRAHIDSRLYDGALEVVEAELPGTGGPAQPTPAEEVLLVAHLCHPQPGAHDNASGAGALIETAATLARLMAAGELPQPARGIRFLWVPEMTGTYAWLSERADEVAAQRWVAGLNLDMVGADQTRTGSVWQLIQLPAAAPGYADHLLAWLREPLLAGQRYEEVPFSAGSDHYILSDPSVGIPTPMLIQWPDTFYHTSADTPEKVSADSLARSGTLAAAYAWWLAAAGTAEARWLAHWMLARFATEAGRQAAAAATHARCEGAADYQPAADFASGRMQAALATLPRLAPEVAAEVPGWQAEAAAIASREAAWVTEELRLIQSRSTAVDSISPGRQHKALLSGEQLSAPGGSATPVGRAVSAAGARAAAAPAGKPAAWHAEAALLVPVRRVPGPIDLGQALPADRRTEFVRLSDEAPQLHDDGARLQYWADGRRTVAEIVELVALETGHRLGELGLRYFRLLAATGYLALVDMHVR